MGKPKSVSRAAGFSALIKGLLDLDGGVHPA